MVATIVQVPQNMEGSAWSELLVQLPLFPPSAHPPSTLYPLLAPLLRQKVGLLSLGRGRNWPGTLTWLPPELSYKVNERLKNTKPSTSLEESFRGYRRFDQETVCNSQPYSNLILYLDTCKRSIAGSKPWVLVYLDFTPRRGNGIRVEITWYSVAGSWYWFELVCVNWWSKSISCRKWNWNEYPLLITLWT